MGSFGWLHRTAVAGPGVPARRSFLPLRAVKCASSFLQRKPRPRQVTVDVSLSTSISSSWPPLNVDIVVFVRHSLLTLDSWSSRKILRGVVVETIITGIIF